MEPPRPKLTLVVFHAAGHNKEDLFRDRESAFQRLRSLFTFDAIPYDQYILNAEANDTTVYLPFIASGGSEALLLRHRHLLPAPFALLYDPYHNSLPAALEIASALEENVPVIGLDALTPQYVETAGHLQRTARSFTRTKAALIGCPSEWLVASAITRTESLTSKCGMRFEKIDPQEVIDRFSHTTGLTSAGTALLHKLETHTKPNPIPSASLAEALKMHQCIEEVINVYGCNALTLRCFDLIAQCGASPCLSLALLNQKGIPAACEGDIPSLMTLTAVRHLTGQPAFMANPNDFDPERHTVTVAHCTVPLDMPVSFRFDTHFETRCSVAIDGRFPEHRPYTLVKWAGENLQRYYAEEGTSLPCAHAVNRCRTQLHLQLNQSFDSFRGKRMANHVIVVEGHHKKLFDAWNLYLTSRH